jgi:hypothetical protein
MQEKYDGGTAFPTSNWQKTVPMSNGYNEGMTLRDYFAAKAMQAMLSSPHCPMHVKESQLATQAYSAADAMLEAREQQ